MTYLFVCTTYLLLLWLLYSSAEHSEVSPSMCTHTRTCAGTGTVHRVRGLRARPFSMTPPCRQPHCIFGGNLSVYSRVGERACPKIVSTLLPETIAKGQGGGGGDERVEGMGISPMGNSCRFPQGKPTATESRYPILINYKVLAGSCSVSVIHRTLTRTA